MHKKICPNCGIHFESRLIRQKCCSKKCQYEFYVKTYSNKVTWNCKTCGKEKITSPSQVRGGYCSRKCQGLGQSGSNNHYWKGGVTPEKQLFSGSKEWKICCKNIWKRDNATCQKCSEKFNHTQKTFEVHHIIPFTHKETRLDESNLVLLCRDCHMWVHSNENTNKEFIKTPSTLGIGA